VARAPFVDIRRGTFLVVWAKVILLATGTGPTMDKIMAPSAEKTTDGMAMAYRIGARCVEMEMVQFHPTGLLMGESGMHGTVLDEGLQGAGGRLFNGRMERFMEQYDPGCWSARRVTSSSTVHTWKSSQAVALHTAASPSTSPILAPALSNSNSLA